MGQCCSSEDGKPSPVKGAPSAEHAVYDHDNPVAAHEMSETHNRMHSTAQPVPIKKPQPKKLSPTE